MATRNFPLNNATELEADLKSIDATLKAAVMNSSTDGHAVSINLSELKQRKREILEDLAKLLPEVYGDYAKVTRTVPQYL